VRLFPRHDLFISIERIAFSTHDAAKVQYRHDLFDNLTAICLYPDSLDTLDFKLEFDASLQGWDPFDFLLDFALCDCRSTIGRKSRWCWNLFDELNQNRCPSRSAGSGSPRPTVEASWPRTVGCMRTSAMNVAKKEMLFSKGYAQKQTGSCRDFAVLLAEVLRAHGLAVRLASGYLWEEESGSGPEHAENAFHAWVETYLPGAGWVGLDPTNGVLCEHHFLATAVGLTASDIAPIVGHYYGKERIASTLETALTIVRS
jgi:hypothetical protein